MQTHSLIIFDCDGTLLDSESSSLFPGALNTLASIKNSLCVASNGPKKHILNALTTCEITHFFNNNIFSAFDINKWKPEPDLFIYAADRMGFAAKDCIVIEDSDIGLIAAKNANMKVAFFNPEKRNCSFEFDYELFEFSDLLNIKEVMQ